MFHTSNRRRASLGMLSRNRVFRFCFCTSVPLKEIAMNVRILRWSLEVFAAACALLLAWTDPSLAQSKIYSTGFEPPTFQAGDFLLGTDGWSPSIPLFLNPAAAVITDTVKKSGKQSVEVRGGDLVSAPLDPDTGMPIIAPYDAAGSYRHPVNYDVTPAKPIVVVEADLFLDTDELATDDDFFSLSIAVRDGDGGSLGEMALSSTGTADVYGSNATSGSPTVLTTPAKLNKWHHLSLVMDYSGETTTVTYLLNGHVIYTDNQTESASKVLRRGSMVVYARPDGDGNARVNYTARFDNFQISAYGIDN